jgi:hypothetical protein
METSMTSAPPALAHAPWCVNFGHTDDGCYGPVNAGLGPDRWLERVPDGTARVVLDSADSHSFTPDEARQYAASLIELADLADAVPADA